MEDAAPLSSIDIEATFLLATPLSPLPTDVDGVCSLAAETENGAGPARGRRAGVEVTVDRGRIVSCITRLKEAPNFAVGPAIAWLEALIHRRPEQLQISGDAHLPNSLVYGIHEQLFDPARFVN